MTQVCEGLRVVDFSTGMAGGIATVVLADNGAEVIKVEPPSGDPARARAAFRQWGRGKKSVVLDLAVADDRARARALAASADVVVDSMAPGEMEKLGLGYAEGFAALNPALIGCSITAFGQRGPYAQYPAYDALVQAKCGRMMDFQGQLERPGPAFTAVPVADFSASQLAIQGIMAALYVRGRTGRGQRVCTSLAQGVSCYDMFNWLSLQLYERFPEVFPRPYLQMGASYHYLVACTKDGHWLQFANAAARLFRAMVRCMGLEEVFEAAGVLGGGLLAGKQATEELWEILFLRLQEKTLEEWMAIFLADEDVSVELFRTPREGMLHPQAIHNGNVVDADDPEVGGTRQVGPLIRFTETPSQIGQPAPALGQHTREMLAAPRAPRAIAGCDPLPRHALEGVTVLELAGFFAAPFGGSLMAELGARVIKIEPLEGDPMRPLQGSTRTVQGKESLALDLKLPEARAILTALVGKADILFHNYRPGVPERLGIDYPALRKVNPRLIYLYAASYGSTGPYSLRPAFHPTFGAIAGGVRRQAGAGMPPPPETELDYAALRRVSNHLARANEGNPDPISALVVGTAMTMALLARERTGAGQYVETTMLGSNAWANSDEFIDFDGAPPLALPDADLRGLGPLYRLYEAGEGWLFLACPSQPEWEALARALGREELLAEPRFATSAGRAANSDALIRVLDATFRTRTAEEWEALLAPRGIGCVQAGAGRYADFFVNDPHVQEAGLSVEVEHPAWGKHRRPAAAVELSLTPGIAGPGNRVGEHTRGILRELGYAEPKIAQLHEAAVVRSPA